MQSCGKSRMVYYRLLLTYYPCRLYFPLEQHQLLCLCRTLHQHRVVLPQGCYVLRPDRVNERLTYSFNSLTSYIYIYIYTYFTVLIVVTCTHICFSFTNYLVIKIVCDFHNAVSCHSFKNSSICQWSRDDISL